MARYVDGFVLPIPKKNAAAYRAMARKAGKIWREHGALAYRECIADDVKPGKVTSFPQSVKLRSDEVVWFSSIVFKSRKHRDRVNTKRRQDLLQRLRPARCRSSARLPRRVQRAPDRLRHQRRMRRR
jgi:uncharacterized protein YbaA (DUF1428 family)